MARRAQQQGNKRLVVVAVPLLLVAGFVFLAMMASPADSTASTAAQFVESYIADHPIAMFSKSYCPYCRRTKMIFQQLGIQPEVVELDLRDDGDDIQNALMAKTHRRTVPQVFVDGKLIGGADDTSALHEKGELKGILESALAKTRSEL
eukprot:jgi/Chlat1/2621/Chrsp178S00155